MPAPELLNAVELAQILGMSVQAIRNALHRGMEGVSIPPSIKLGSKRRWLRCVVYAWLREKAKALKGQSARRERHEAT